METYERRIRSLSIAIRAFAGTLVILAAYLLFGLGMWLKALFFALLGIALFMMAFSLKVEWDAGGRLLFWLGVIFIFLAEAAFGYGLYRMVFN